MFQHFASIRLPSQPLAKHMSLFLWPSLPIVSLSRILQTSRPRRPRLIRDSVHLAFLPCRIDFLPSETVLEKDRRRDLSVLLAGCRCSPLFGINSTCVKELLPLEEDPFPKRENAVPSVAPKVEAWYISQDDRFAFSYPLPRRKIAPPIVLPFTHRSGMIS